MSNPQTLTTEPITQSDVHRELEEIQERDEELSFRAGKSLDHLNHLSLVSEEKQEKITQAIEELNVPRLKKNHIAKIIDVMPRNIKELGLIISGYTLTVNKEYQEKIIEALQANA